jgi:hypothetical protein
MYKIRAFWALDNRPLCEAFAEGHRNVLLENGIKKVTSADNSWMESPMVYVIVCEDENGDVVGGARLHIAHPDYPLPMQEAIAQVDLRINKYVEEYTARGTAELCGLWNSRKVAGRGIGVKMLPLAAFAITQDLELNTLLALVAKHTLKQSLNWGFKRFEKVGDHGEFNYPKLDLIATSVIIEDTSDIGCKKPADYEMIESLRQNKIFEKRLSWARGEFDIHIDIHIDKIHWKDYISSPKD